MTMRMNTKMARVTELQGGATVSHGPFAEIRQAALDSESTPKERLCLEYVHRFQDQFRALYPRRNLYLTAANENAAEKLVCTTLRPTQLPFRELYDFRACANFVARYLDYEPLEDPHHPPEVLPSPARTLEWCKGDSFDFAVLLASFLLGAGYDAYVVYGFAPKWITCRDESSTECPLMEEIERERANDYKLTVTQPVGVAAPAKASARGPAGERIVSAAAEAKDNAGETSGESANEDDEADEKEEFYQLRRQGVPDSTYVQRLKDSEKDTEDTRFDPWEHKLHTEEDELGAGQAIPHQLTAHGLDALPKDVDHTDLRRAEEALNQRLVHAWVLVRAGKRDVEEMVFVEPTTGRTYTPSESPYLRIESIWNAKNFWINLNEEQEASRVAFDLDNTDLWEHVFVESMRSARTDRGKEQTGGQGEEEHELGDLGEIGIGHDSTDAAQDAGEPEDDDNALTVPPSWVPKLSMDRIRIQTRYPPSGSRVIWYRKAKLELYSNNTNAQGMVRRLIIFRDTRRIVVREIHEWYEHRRDRLCRRIRNPMTRVTREYFLPGAMAEVKEWIDHAGCKRELHFYVNARMDGLRLREEVIGEKIVEHFEGRGDRLVYRSATLTMDRSKVKSKAPYTLPGAGLGGDLYLKKMTEKYSRPDDNAHDAISKRTFFSSEGWVRTINHFGDAQITRTVRFHHHSRHGTSATDDGNDDPSRLPASMAIHGATLPAARPSTSGSTADHHESKAADNDTDGIAAVAVAERNCFAAVKASASSMQQLLKTRYDVEVNVIIDRPVFETALERLGTDGDADVVGAREDEGDTKQVDYLTPFLKDVKDLSDVQREEAQVARDACLKALKDRLLERANIIQERLNEENMKLAKKQEQFQRNQREGDISSEEFEKYCTEAMFRIQILEQRLVAHEEAALKKFADLDNKLSNDPRLAVLRNT